MKGLVLVRHSATMIFHDLGETIRAMALPTLRLAVVSSAMLGSGETLAGSLARLFLYLWIAVSWHRYVLQGERTPIPPLARLLPYLGISLLILFLAVVSGAILGLPMALVFLLFPISTLSPIIFAVQVVIVATVMARLSVGLPAAAIGVRLA